MRTKVAPTTAPVAGTSAGVWDVTVGNKPAIAVTVWNNTGVNVSVGFHDATGETDPDLGASTGFDFILADGESWSGPISALCVDPSGWRSWLPQLFRRGRVSANYVYAYIDTGGTIANLIVCTGL